MDQTDYPDLPFAANLVAFDDLRTHLLAVLEPLDAVGWQHSATVTGAGRPLRLTVASYADRMARHERPQLTQLAQALAV